MKRSGTRGRRPGRPKRQRVSSVNRGEQACFVDTSVLIRYLTGDMPERLEAATRILDESPTVYLTEGTLTETAYVLTSFYEVPRERVVDSLIDLVSKENVVLHGLDKGVAVQALLMCRPSKRVSFADALLWAAAVSRKEPACVYSFDKRFPNVGLERREDR